MNEDHGTENADGDGEIVFPPINPTAIPEHTSMDPPAEFKLSVGSFDLKNEQYRKVLIGPMTAPIRKAIGKPAILSHPGKLTTAVLIEVLSFPNFDFDKDKSVRRQEKKLLVQSMYSADRSSCLLECRKRTRKNQDIVQRTECPSCGAEVEIFTSPEEIETFMVEDTDYELVEAENEVLLVVKEMGQTVRFKLSRGFDEENMPIEVMRNIGEASLEIVAQCTYDFNGEHVDEAFYDRLDLNITDPLTDTFTGNQPGPDVFKKAKCPECNANFDYGVEPSDFIMPSVRQRRLRRRSKKSDSSEKCSKGGPIKSSGK